MKRVGVVIAIVLATGLSSAAQNEDLSVLKRWVEWSNAANSLQLHLNQEAFKLLAARREAVGKLRSAADWKARQQSVRASLLKALGPFPEKTPLNAQVLGVTQRPGYRIEKIVFESVPGFFVTACLFIPDNLPGRAPAILNLIGHTDIAFRGPMYQQLILNLVEKKFIVLAVDPIGQGERLQYYDPQLKRSTVGGPTTEHSYVGRQCFLAGSSLARYFTWDGIRAIDYLISRSEVDAARIGVTGISGGGTQTSYVAAIDERVAAAAPACYITGFQRLLESIGLGDAEQNFVRGLQEGIDHPDFLEVRAPRPTLVVATTRDFFSIQGARETVEEAKTAFQALGAEDNLSIVEDDFGHGYTRKTREGIYAFFQKHLNNPGSSSDREIELLAPEALTVTATGQVSTSLRGETAFTLNRSVAVALADKLDRSRADLPAHLARAASEARALSGYVQPEAVTRAVFRGRFARDGYNVELYALGGEGRLIIPVVLMVPDKPGRHLGLIYLHPGGKSEAAAPGGEMEWLARRGYVVLSADLAGMGELGSVDTLLAYLGVQTGRSVVGLRAADIVRCARFLRARADVDSRGLTAVGRAGTAIPLLHAAVFENTFASIVLVDPLLSYRSMALNRFYNVDFANVVSGALGAYDLPDLQAALAPRRLLVINPQDHLLTRADGPTVTQELEFVRLAYKRAGADANFAVRTREPHQTLDDVLQPWLDAISLKEGIQK